jgi:hypothetical protein
METIIRQYSPEKVLEREKREFCDQMEAHICQGHGLGLEESIIDLEGAGNGERKKVSMNMICSEVSYLPGRWLVFWGQDQTLGDGSYQNM